MTRKPSIDQVMKKSSIDWKFWLNWMPTTQAATLMAIELEPKKLARNDHDNLITLRKSFEKIKAKMDKVREKIEAMPTLKKIENWKSTKIVSVLRYVGNSQEYFVATKQDKNGFIFAFKHCNVYYPVAEMDIFRIELILELPDVSLDLDYEGGESMEDLTDKYYRRKKSWEPKEEDEEEIVITSNKMKVIPINKQEEEDEED